MSWMIDHERLETVMLHSSWFDGLQLYHMNVWLCMLHFLERGDKIFSYSSNRENPAEISFEQAGHVPTTEQKVLAVASGILWF